MTTSWPICSPSWDALGPPSHRSRSPQFSVHAVSLPHLGSGPHDTQISFLVAFLHQPLSAVALGPASPLNVHDTRAKCGFYPHGDVALCPQNTKTPGVLHLHSPVPPSAPYTGSHSCGPLVPPSFSWHVLLTSPCGCQGTSGPSSPCCHPSHPLLGISPTGIPGGQC